MANRDYNGSPQSPGYLQWLEDGGVPDPVPPIVVATLNSVGNARTAAQILGAA
jgi:hypothetical protein